MATPRHTRRVIDQQRDRVYTLARYTLGSDQDAEDVTQEVLLRYWRHADRVDPERVEGWLVRVTTNACRDLARRRTARPESTGGEQTEAALQAAHSAEPDPSAGAEATETTQQVEALLAMLGEPYRSIVVLREVQGLAYQEIADALDLPLTRVRVYLHRGRRRLAEMAALEPQTTEAPRPSCEGATP